jgi:hypothetical protein
MFSRGERRKASGEEARTHVHGGGFNFQPLSEDEKREFGAQDLNGNKVIARLEVKKRSSEPTAA